MIGNNRYKIVGWINFQSTNENSHWTEYRMFDMNTQQEWWLSADEYNNEYSLSHIRSRGISVRPDLQGYHEVDRGTAVVMSYGGNVDVDMGETVNYTEYEDLAEDNIKSIEQWEDETEYSEGFYIDTYDIESLGVHQQPQVANDPVKLITLVVVLIFSMPLLSIIPSILTANNQSAIKNYLASSQNYSYTTSITSNINNKDKADVYSTVLSVDEASKDILKGIDGSTESVQQNTEDLDDNSVAIMTKKEYCLVYTDSETNKTLVQISTRQYTYSNDNDLYHSRSSTRRYYRRFYHSRGHSYDKKRYKKHTDSYSDYSGGALATNSNDSYNTYSKSVRQSSVASRSSSGGGTSSGK